MMMTEAFFSCDTRRWARFLALCDEAGDAPDAVLADLVRREIQRRERRKARSDEVIDERLLVRLRLLVAEALAEAETWGELQRALSRRGLRLRPAGGGLTVTVSGTGRSLCKLSQAGPGYAALIRRFGAGFPGHRHTKLTRRILGRDEGASSR